MVDVHISLKSSTRGGHKKTHQGSAGNNQGIIPTVVVSHLRADPIPIKGRGNIFVNYNRHMIRPHVNSCHY